MVVEALRQHEIAPARMRVVGEFAGDTAAERLVGDKQIVHGHDLVGAALDRQRIAGRGTVVHDGVVNQVEHVERCLVALGAEGDDVGVLGLRALFDQIADHVGDAAVGKLQLVAGVTTGLIAEAVVEDEVLERPALEQVAAARMVRIGAGHAQASDVADVDIVGAAVARAVVAELRVFDIQRHIRVAAGEDAVFIVLELAVPDDQLPAFEADAGAVVVGHARAAKLQVLDRDAAAAHHPDALSLGIGAGRDEARPRLADAAYGQAVLLPHRHVAHIVTGFDLDSVAVARHGRRHRQVVYLLLRADADQARRGGRSCSRGSSRGSGGCGTGGGSGRFRGGRAGRHPAIAVRISRRRGCCRLSWSRCRHGNQLAVAVAAYLADVGGVFRQLAGLRQGYQQERQRQAAERFHRRISSGHGWERKSRGLAL